MENNNNTTTTTTNSNRGLLMVPPNNGYVDNQTYLLQQQLLQANGGMPPGMNPHFLGAPSENTAGMATVHANQNIALRAAQQQQQPFQTAPMGQLPPQFMMMNPSTQGVSAPHQSFIPNNLLSTLAGGNLAGAAAGVPPFLSAAASAQGVWMPQQPVMPYAIVPPQQGQQQQQQQPQFVDNATAAASATAAGSQQQQQPAVAMIPAASLPQPTQLQYYDQSMFRDGIHQLQQYGALPSMGGGGGFAIPGLGQPRPVNIPPFQQQGQNGTLVNGDGKTDAAGSTGIAANNGVAGHTDDQDANQDTSGIPEEEGKKSDSSSAAAAAVANIPKKKAPRTKKKKKVSVSHAEKWNRMFAKLKAYYDEHGDCLVPFHLKSDPALGWWVHSQRSHKNTMIAERKEKLDSLNFTWKQRNKESWDETFSRLVVYREKYGNCSVPEDYEEDPKLAAWVIRQRSVHKSLSHEKQARLEKLGFEWTLG